MLRQLLGPVLILGWNQANVRPGESPLDFLQHAIFCYASAIKIQPKDASLHLNLGFVLEERYLAEDLYGLKPTVIKPIPFCSIPMHLKM